jgi:NAD-dependent deacetylase
LRPAVVFFGEALNSEILRLAFEEAENCDLFLAVGSSLVVYPAADIPRIAKQGGGTLALINKQKTPLDVMADYVINDEAGRILPQIIRILKDG